MTHENEVRIFQMEPRIPASTLSGDPAVVNRLGDTGLNVDSPASPESRMDEYIARLTADLHRAEGPFNDLVTKGLKSGAWRTFLPSFEPLDDSRRLRARNRRGTRIPGEPLI